MTTELQTADLTQQIAPSNRTRVNIVTITLIFCFSIIIFAIGWGDPTNSLHSSALAWAFAMTAAVVGAYVFGTTWDNITFSKKP